MLVELSLISSNVVCLTSSPWTPWEEELVVGWRRRPSCGTRAWRRQLLPALPHSRNQGSARQGGTRVKDQQLACGLA